MNCKVTMASYRTIFVLTIIIGVLITRGLSIPFDVDVFDGQKAWLEQYKYLGKDSIIPGISSLTSDEAFVKAVKMMQRFVGLPETGIVDDKTKEYMRNKRCGMNDMSDVSMFNKRKRRYVLQGSQYPPGKTLTYRINAYSTQFDAFLQDQIFKEAFEYWSRVADIKFRQVKDTTRVDVDIMFTTGNHGDYEPFDGRGGILAHAFFPNFGGDEHYDDSEYWTHRENRGTNLFQTVTHEIGHTLGLSHSGKSDSIMFPYIKPYNPGFKLGNDDIVGIQSLYGPAKTFTNTFTPMPSNTPRPMAPPPQPSVGSPPRNPFNPFDNCYSGSIDAITQAADKSTYIFRGDYVYKINGLGVEYGYPVRINDAQFGFHPMSGKIDAALYWPTNRKTYLFKDHYVAVFDGRTFDRYMHIDDVLKIPKEAQNMDTVFYWPRNGKTYVTKGNIYWRFETGSGQMDPGYPQQMYKWSLPGGVDAAFEYSNGRTYFFKGDQYFKFDDAKVMLHDGYPRPINYWWFGCRSSAASSGIIELEANSKDPQMDVVQPVNANKVNPFTEAGENNTSSRVQGSFVLTFGLFLCISLQLNIFS